MYLGDDVSIYLQVIILSKLASLQVLKFGQKLGQHFPNSSNDNAADDDDNSNNSSARPRCKCMHFFSGQGRVGKGSAWPRLSLPGLCLVMLVTSALVHQGGRGWIWHQSRAVVLKRGRTDLIGDQPKRNINIPDPPKNAKLL